MAFQVSNIKISGTIDGLSFYNSVFGWLVRRKAGPTRKQFKTSPNFARARENSSEFVLCSRAASAIRRMVLKYTCKKDTTLYHRLIKLMRLLAYCDQSSVRAHRDPLKGMQTVKGKLLLKNFEVNIGLSLYKVLITVGYLKGSSRIKKRIDRPYVYRVLSTNTAHYLSHRLNKSPSPVTACAVPPPQRGG